MVDMSSFLFNHGRDAIDVLRQCPLYPCRHAFTPASFFLLLSQSSILSVSTPVCLYVLSPRFKDAFSFWPCFVGSSAFPKIVRRRFLLRHATREAFVAEVVASNAAISAMAEGPSCGDRCRSVCAQRKSVGNMCQNRTQPVVEIG